MRLHTRSLISFLSLTISLTAHGFLGGANYYRIQGYKNKTHTAQNKINVTAKESKGLSRIGFEKLESPVIEIENKTGKLVLKSESALFKGNEIILAGHATAVFTDLKEKKTVFEMKSLPPDDTIYLDLEINQLKGPSAELKFKKATEKGRSLIINFSPNEIFWLSKAPNRRVF